MRVLQNVRIGVDGVCGDQKTNTIEMEKSYMNIRHGELDRLDIQRKRGNCLLVY